jgi:hypothetical protein
MKISLRAAVLVLVAITASSAVALPPPEPLPMGTPYVYQVGNPYWYLPVYPYPSYYPFGATKPVFGRYSWDYGVYYPYKPVWYAINYPVYGYTYQYRDVNGRTVTVHAY